MRKIHIFDTTLRDGDQSLAISMDAPTKLELARQIAKLQVDVLEAGFPASSPGDYQSVQAIGRKMKGVIVCGLARCLKKDIDICLEALKPAENPRINLGIAVSALHMQKKLRLSPDQVIERAAGAVRYARKSLPEVQFYAEDAFRSDPAFLTKVYEAVITAGANVITLSDTVGCATPWSVEKLVTHVTTSVRNIDKAMLSIHCHDDLGMATANSIAGVIAGVDQVECTVNGIGERAGNAALEEVAMAVLSQREHSMSNHPLADVDITLCCREIYATSQAVAFHTGIPIPRHKAVVGENVYSHASGIHQDGMIKAEKTYQFIDPRTVGAPGCQIVLNARSGRHALKYKLEQMGVDLNHNELERVYHRFIELAESGDKITHLDLPQLLLKI